MLKSVKPRKHKELLSCTKIYCSWGGGGGGVKKLTEKRRKEWLVNLRLWSGGADRMMLVCANG